MDREEIIAAFKDVLEECQTRYSVKAPREGSISIACGFTLESKISRVMGVFEFRQAFIRIFAFSLDDPLVTKNRTEMLRLLAMANQDMAAGCFEYEMETDEIRFRFFVDCDGYATLPRDFVQDTLLHPFRMFQRYGDAFVAVATGATDAATAFAAARPYDDEDDDETDDEYDVEVDDEYDVETDGEDF